MPRPTVAHVLVFAPSRVDAAAIARLPGVTEHGPLFRSCRPRFGRVTGVTGELADLGRDASVNVPLLTAGSQLQEGDGVVLERSLAGALGIEIGSTLRLSGPTGRDRRPRPRHGDRSESRRATRGPSPAWHGSAAGRSNDSSRIAPAGGGRKQSGWRIPPQPTPSPRMRRRASRHRSPVSGELVARPGTNSETARWETHRARR